MVGVAPVGLVVGDACLAGMTKHEMLLEENDECTPYLLAAGVGELLELRA